MKRNLTRIVSSLLWVWNTWHHLPGKLGELASPTPSPLEDVWSSCCLCFSRSNVPLVFFLRWTTSGNSVSELITGISIHSLYRIQIRMTKQTLLHRVNFSKENASASRKCFNDSTWETPSQPGQDTYRVPAEYLHTPDTSQDTYRLPHTSDTCRIPQTPVEMPAGYLDTPDTRWDTCGVAAYTSLDTHRVPADLCQDTIE